MSAKIIFKSNNHFRHNSWVNLCLIFNLIPIKASACKISTNKALRGIVAMKTGFSPPTGTGVWRNVANISTRITLIACLMKSDSTETKFIRMQWKNLDYAMFSAHRREVTQCCCQVERLGINSALSEDNFLHNWNEKETRMLILFMFGIN